MNKNILILLALALIFCSSISFAAIFASDSFVIFDGSKKAKEKTVIAELVTGTSNQKYSFYEINDVEGRVYFRQNYTSECVEIIFHKVRKAVISRKDWYRNQKNNGDYRDYLKGKISEACYSYSLPGKIKYSNTISDKSNSDKLEKIENVYISTSMVLGEPRDFEVNIKQKTFKEVLP